MDLSAREIERAKFTFSIYDFNGTNTIDAYNLADALRALGLNPTLKMVNKLGGLNRKGEKTYTIEEFLPIYSDAKKDKDIGNIDDYVECLKLYDKDGDGNMLVNQLNHILLAYGEKLDASEASFIIKDCSDPPDEDGLIKYVPFLKRMVDGPHDVPPPPLKIRPSIVVADAEDCPTVSYAAAKPLVMAVTEPEDEDEEPVAATFTLKKPGK